MNHKEKNNDSNIEKEATKDQSEKKENEVVSKALEMFGEDFVEIID